VDRTACIDLPAFPLQWLLRTRGAAAEESAAVVEATRPQARILFVNEAARARGVRTGMRYAAALALDAGLRAEAVPPEEVARGVALVVGRLRRLSPDVEPCAEEPGVFFVGARGLERLHPSLEDWAAALLGDLKKARLSGRVVVGFRRFPVYAIARAGAGPEVVVLGSPEEELARAREVPLERVQVAPDARDGLHDLKVRRLGELLRLPEEGLAARFGGAMRPLVEGARGGSHLPVQPAPDEEPLLRRLPLDHAVSDRERLALLFGRMLAPALAALAARRRAVAELRLGMKLDRGGERLERIRPAAATLDARRLLSLVRLRLESVELSSGAVELTLDADEAPPPPGEEALFGEAAPRDLRAAAEALARIRAESGEESVVRARLLDAHLPEARFAWEPFPEPAPPRARATAERPLVRRIFRNAAPFPHRLAKPLAGPFVLSGGWWRAEAQREYHYLRDAEGGIVWAFFDRVRGVWRRQGTVE